MRTSSLPSEPWRALITALREKAPPYLLEYTDQVEQQLEQNAPSQLTVRLSVTHDVSYQCVTLAAVSL